MLTPENYYHDHEYITNSMIRDFLEKWEYYYYLKHIKWIKEPYLSKDYFDFGKAVDIFFESGRDMFEKMVHIVSRRTGNVAFGEVELTTAAGESVNRTIDEMNNQPLIRLYNTGEKQKILQVEDYRGMKLKGKLDNINVEEGFISDIKTTANIETFEPGGYTTQLTMYGLMAEMIYQKPFRLFLLVGDKYSDYARSEVFEMSETTRMMALDKIHNALDLIKDRMEYNTWAIPQDRRAIFGTALYRHMPNYEIKEPIQF